jgi:hypothetical protein
MLFIASLGHSGSTLLDLMLSTTRRAVSFGEVATVLTAPAAQMRENACSCGHSGADCPFWSTVLAKNDALEDGTSLADRYAVLVDIFMSQYGKEMALVDSSKNAPVLKELLDVHPAYLQVSPLHLVRDVRSYAISQLDNHRRKQTTGVSWRSALPEFHFRNWHRKNCQIEGVLAKSKDTDSALVSYEGLCLAPETTAASLTDVFGTEYIDPSAAPNAGIHHILSGNRMRRIPEKSTRLRYDFRWFFRTEWQRPSLIMPWVMHYNRGVYKRTAACGTYAQDDSQPFERRLRQTQ